MKLRICVSVLLVTMALSLFGCGKEDDLDAYQKEMATFSNNITELDSKMNAINPSSDEAVTELLGYLDTMNDEFTKLAEMEVPDEFVSVENLADEAGTYMSEAVSLYRKVFSSEEYDDYSATLADESYNRALKRLHYISEILQGREPEGEDITYVTDENIPTNEKKPSSKYTEMTN